MKVFLLQEPRCVLELPGKGCVTLPVDTIEPPVVLLKDNSVVRVTMDNFADVKGKIQKILFLGDILISFGDFLYSNKALPTSGTLRNGGLKTFRTYSPTNLVAIAREHRQR